MGLMLTQAGLFWKGSAVGFHHEVLGAWHRPEPALAVAAHILLHHSRADGHGTSRTAGTGGSAAKCLSTGVCSRASVTAAGTHTHGPAEGTATGAPVSASSGCRAVAGLRLRVLIAAQTGGKAFGSSGWRWFCLWMLLCSLPVGALVWHHGYVTQNSTNEGVHG